MVFDPTTLAAAFVLLSTVLGALLLFAWTQNRKARALAWWGATFCLIPVGIGMANLGHGAPGHLNLLVANAFVTLGYGALYADCLTFNERPWRWSIIVIGPAIWVAAFPFIHETLSARLVLLALISGGYAALSGWELWKHAPQQLASQRAAVILLYGLAVFNLLRALTGLSLGTLFGMNLAVSRWSPELALFLVVYAPTLGFIFLFMAKERIELDQKCTEQALRESEEHYRYSVELNPQMPWTADPQGRFLDMSPRLQALSGVRMRSVFDTEGAKALHPKDIAPVRQHWAHSLATGELFDQELRLRLLGGSYRWLRVRAAPRRDPRGTIIRWYGTAEDIQDRKLAEEQLQWAAHHDDLTGLANRRLFLERLRQAHTMPRDRGMVWAC